MLLLEIYLIILKTAVVSVTNCYHIFKKLIAELTDFTRWAHKNCIFYNTMLTTEPVSYTHLKWLAGKRFTDCNQVSDAVNVYFEYLEKSPYQFGITTLVHCWKKRIEIIK